MLRTKSFAVDDGHALRDKLKLPILSGLDFAVREVNAFQFLIPIRSYFGKTNARRRFKTLLQAVIEIQTKHTAGLRRGNQ